MPGVLRDEVTGLAGDRHPERAQVAGDRRRVRVEVDRLFGVPCHAPEPSADVDLTDRAAGIEQAAGHAGDTLEDALEGRQPVGQPAGAGVDVDAYRS